MDKDHSQKYDTHLLVEIMSKKIFVVLKLIPWRCQYRIYIISLRWWNLIIHIHFQTQTFKVCLILFAELNVTEALIGNLYSL